MKGMKFDQQKQKWHALPLVLLEPLADVMEAGAKKYEKFNCLEPFDNWDERFWNSTMRHLKACQIDPLAIDEETGCYHAAQACFGMLMRIFNARREYASSDTSADELSPLTGLPAEGTGMPEPVVPGEAVLRDGDQKEGGRYRGSEEYPGEAGEYEPFPYYGRRP